jgi:ABC-type multidrug transport system ATPase subunit
LQNVYKNYSNVQALNNVSYKINNERVALLGHNGAGKSTTFGLLSAQLNASSGTIYL